MPWELARDMMLSAPDPSCLQGVSSGSSRRMSSASMDRISQWVASQEIPSDLTVRIADSVFPLHKAVMVPKCGYIRRAVAAVSSKDTAPVELYLSAIPGGADAFEKVALYCYGADLEITARNAAALLCAAAFLDLEHQPSDRLSQRVEEFFARAGLRTLPNAVAVLRSCEGLLPTAVELGVTRRAADAVALKICNEALFRTRAPPGWWTAELAALKPASFGKVVTALQCRRAGPEVIAAAAAAYAEITLAEVLADPTSNNKGAGALVESVVDVLPPSADAPLPAALLCRLLHAAVNADACATKTCRDLELRVAAVLDQVTAADLVGVALDGAGERVAHTDTVRRVVAAFVEQQSSVQKSSRRRRASLSGRSSSEAAPEHEDKVTMEKVARTVDEAAAEMATEESLPVSKFVGVCGAVPRDARASHDWVYRAVDIYLKTHPELDEIGREKVCSVMDPLKLSYQARLHASQNKRLPLQAVLSALYYDNLKLRSSSTTVVNEESEASLARENEALRSELARMRAYVSGMQQHNSSKGSGSSSAKKKKKKASFLLLGSAVTRTLGRLNPFKATGWVKDTSSIRSSQGNTIRDHVLNRPKRRRFSIS